MSTRLILRNVRFSYFKAFAPSTSPSGKLQYSTAVLLPKDHPQIADICKAFDAEVAAKWPDLKKRPKPLHSPLRDADAEAEAAGSDPDPNYAGHYFMNLSASAKDKSGADLPAPGVIDGAKQPASPQQWGSGDYGNVSVTLYPIPEMAGYKKGIAAALNNVQFVRKGEPMGGRVSADAEFGVESTESDDL
jgi:hypothetical protein